MTKELILPPKPVLGKVRLELLDPDSRKVLERVEAENYIAQQFLDHNAWRQRQEYVSGLTGTDAEPRNPMVAMMLWDRASAEVEPSGSFDGLCTAWSLPSSYSGADTRRGTIVPGESYCNPEEAVYVFEWPTTAGNGIVRAASWAANNDWQPQAWLVDSLVNPGLSGASGAAGFCFDPYDGDTFWAVVGGSLRKYLLDLSAGTVSELFVGPTNAQMGVTYVYGIAVDATHCYVAGSTSTIRKFPKPTGSGDVTESAISIAGVTAPTDIAYDGSYLWVLQSESPYKAYRVDKSSGAIERSFSVPGRGNNGGTSFNVDRQLLTVSTQSGTWTGYSAYDLDGALQTVWRDTRVSNSTTLHSWIDKNRFLCRGQFLNNSTQGLEVWRTDVLGTRSTLGADVEKTNLTGMKLTYTFTFS